ncbi:MAG: rod shape-determining protein MreC [Planctomycetota bacterium]
MRVRKQHAWGAVLIVLFILPVAMPQGIPALERPVAGFFAFFGRIPALNPRLWGTGGGDDEAESPRARALEVENALLREHLSERRQVETDLSRFAKVLQEGGLDRLPRARVARVLRASDPSGYRRSILIDRGEADGVREGSAVVTGAIFLGRVVVVHARSALVELITDRRSRLEVATRTDRQVRLRGFLSGRGHGTVEEDLTVRHIHVPPDAGRVLVGAPVVTSNADPRIPAGLLVGYVTEDRNRDDLPTVRVHPAFDLTRSTRVFVLLPP